MVSVVSYPANNSKELEKVLVKISNMKKSELRKLQKMAKRIKEMCSYEQFQKLLNENLFKKMK